MPITKTGGWILPRARVRDAHVVDPDRFNEALRRTRELVDSGFGEANIGEDLAVTRVTNYDDAISMRSALILAESGDDFWADTVNRIGADETTLMKAWQPVDDMDYTFESRGGDLYILFSGQYSAYTSDQAGLAYVQVAIELDGVIYPESIIPGDLDLWPAAPNMEQGIGGYHQGLFSEVIIPSVSPGSHRVRVLAKAFDIPEINYALDLETFIYQRQLYIEEDIT